MQTLLIALGALLAATPTRTGLDDPTIVNGARDTGGRVTLAIYECTKPVICAINDLEQALSSSPEARANVAVVRRNVEHEARLIDDLLDLTRVVRGKLNLRREVLNAPPPDRMKAQKAACVVCRKRQARGAVDMVPQGRVSRNTSRPPTSSSYGNKMAKRRVSKSWRAKIGVRRTIETAARRRL